MTSLQGQGEEGRAKQRRRPLLSWSSGKDSAWALHLLRQQGDVELRGLFTTVNRTHARVSMHGVCLELLQCQAEAVGLPLEVIDLPDPCSNAQYESIMARFVGDALAARTECMAFGDLYLEDVRTYRERQLQASGLTALFPLWKLPTRALAEQMLSAGVQAFITCVDPKQVPADLAGKQWSMDLIAALPKNVDPCGEKGEFHTVVVGGPMFRTPIPVAIGETVEREGFVFADVIPL